MKNLIAFTLPNCEVIAMWEQDNNRLVFADLTGSQVTITETESVVYDSIFGGEGQSRMQDFEYTQYADDYVREKYVPNIDLETYIKELDKLGEIETFTLQDLDNKDYDKAEFLGKTLSIIYEKLKISNFTRLACNKMVVCK